MPFWKAGLASLSCATSLTAVMALPAHGQPAGGTTAGELEDIVVTANRRAEPLQDVPVTVSVLTSDALRRENITSNQDLAGKVPSLVVGQSSGQRNTQSFNLRGQGSTYGGGPGVAAYFAEVPLPQASDTVAQLGTDTLFFDLQNVQVLKGPQGTLFGRNTTGGAVLLEPKRPENALGGYLQLQAGNYSDREVEAAVNLPLQDDRLMLRVAGRFVDRDGYTRDVVTGKDYDDRHYWALRSALTWRPTDDIQNYLMFTAFRSSTNGTGNVIQDFNLQKDAAGNYVSSVARYYGEPLLRQVLAEQQARSPRRVQLNGDPYDKRSMWMLTDILEVSLSPELKLRNVASYARFKTSTDADLDGSRLDALQTSSGNDNSTNARQWTEEFQLQGSASGDQITYVAGVYHEDVKPLGTEFRGNLVPRMGNLNNIIQGSTRQSTGVYAQTAIGLGILTPALEPLRLTMGGRYTWDRRDDFYKWTVNGRCLLSIATLPECLVSAKTRNSAPTWTIGLDYHVSRDVLAFVKASRGYKGGGFNFNGTNPIALTFGPEEVTTYEAGLKTQFRLGGMPVRLNSAAYYSDYRDIQRVGPTTLVRPDGGISTGSATVNAGKAHIQGLEVEGSISPVSGLVLAGSYSYTDAKYDDFKFYYLQSGIIVADDRSSVPFQFAPKNQFSLSASYTVDLGKTGTIIPSVSFAHVDRYYTQITIPVGQPGGTEPYGWLPASNLLNMRLDWRDIGGTPVDLAIFATNVANKAFPVQLQSNIGKNGGSWGQGFARYLYSEPRMYGVQLRLRFGSER
ncbi:TonB-dependent receptor [Sphingobium sp.]|uniref:TonB-dependent receptor n=1 Tax=Sphingobium sp. TaxID=1912891 RepID=UPI0035C69484